MAQGGTTTQQGNGLAIAGLVCGIVGLLFFNVILGPLAIIFGVIDLIVFAVLVAVSAKNGGFFSFQIG